ncbi:hypothetical protein [Desulforegula conservatrix]|uniref:hypothetical protein n=1 Tax=Desulforegula conservatrix TaxID=153026 RepID=UPI0006859637|nr:hypothetical protein [Desulforegula conservatrix]
MAGRMLTYEDGIVMLNGEILPGILKHQSARGSVRFDETKQDGGGSGKVKVAMGWEDADVSLTLELLTDDQSTCYDKLSKINSIFKGHDSGGRPGVYSVNNPMLTAMGIRQVIFCGLDSMESDQDDVIDCQLSFVEEGIDIQTVENRASSGDKASTNLTKTKTPGGTKPNPEPDNRINVDVM